MSDQNYVTPHHEVRVIRTGRVRDKKHLEDIRKGCLDLVGKLITIK